MNIRQLRELVLETVAKEQRKNRSQRRNNSRRKQLKRIMENARKKLNEQQMSSVEDYYDDTLRANQPGPDANKINIFSQFGIDDADQNAQLWQSLYEDNPTGATVTSGQVAAENMLPTQSQIGSANSLGNIFFGGGYKGDGFHISKQAKALRESGTLTWKTPILAAKGKGDKIYIIDGHHRWSQAYMLDPKIQMNCTILVQEKLSADDILQAVHIAISENTEGDGAAPYSLGKKFNGTNMLSSEVNAATLIEEYAKTLLDPNDWNPKAKGQALGGKISREMKEWALSTALENDPEAKRSWEKAQSSRGIVATGVRKKYQHDGSFGRKKKWGYDGLGNRVQKYVNDSYDRDGTLLKEVYNINAQALADKGGSTLPLAIGGPDCTIEQYKQHFIDAITSMQEIYASGDTSGEAPYRNMMPQADDMFGDKIKGMQTGGRGVFDHIAQGKITLPKRAVTSMTPDASGRMVNAEQPPGSSTRPRMEATWHKGNRLNENAAKNTDKVLSRWKKLAGLD